MLKGTPAPMLAGAASLKWSAAAALTRTVALPVVERLAGSVAGGGGRPAGGFGVGGEAARRVGGGGVGGQPRLAVAAGEGDRTGVGGRGVVERVQGRDREGEGGARRGRRGGADAEVRRGRGADRD